ncbi:hypothetical protein J7384_18500 [Endozoicomonas sp. G2_1]|uniref:hypothetical protein n=1 Tax=Endozoicomonas sp. G2_1 TaxID=2821091 RepID=UPI001AD9E58F|nr:hypothetical protein [Endozoicomonas sp. G2_1]MBO9492359.1 hypothetical protein [Endozoicomonas sp. G2_1]
MRVFLIFFLSIFLWSCSEAQVEEFAFRKTLEFSLVDLCGEEDKECIAAVKSQISGCMEESNWRKYLENQDDPEEVNRFVNEFYSCITDDEGNPYFESNV